jgi:hypothetical protein
MMCPTALQTASGIVYAGVSQTQIKTVNETRTWADLAEQFVEFQSPRVLTAGKLALRGVQINSYPLNMDSVSSFRRLQQIGNVATTQVPGFQTGDFAGFAPIVIFNPSEADLELLVTVEMRLRFDFGHPAASSHKAYPVASDSTWNTMMQKAVALGNGVMDIAEGVANLGGRVAAFTGRGVPALPMLVD